MTNRRRDVGTAADGTAQEAALLAESGGTAVPVKTVVVEAFAAVVQAR